MNRTLIVDRNDFSRTEFVDVSSGDLADDHVRIEIISFALTANNITYMAVGDMIGYWKYFDPKHYGITRPDMGCMPVWGYGVVRESKCEKVNVGAQVYGFFPVAKHIDVRPVKCNVRGFQDGVAHRADLHSVYNVYIYTKNDPSFLPAFDELQPVLRPLFTTSFLLDDFFGEQNHFGARQIIVLSASSKTALGTAFCLKQRGGIRLVGLTSRVNAEFVQGTGFYDEVVNYESIASLDPNAKTALIDMAGNGRINGALYDHFGYNIVYNCMVGKSHWQGERPPKITVGAPPVMFFAPDQAKKRIGEWGGAGFAKKMGARWIPFCENAQHWMTIESYDGAVDVLECYNNLLAGRVDPSRGQIFKL